jgi:stage II sporulation protein D
MRTRRFQTFRKFSVSLLSVTFLGGLLQIPWAPAAHAISGSTQIRVGLMINSGPLHSTTDTVTLSGRSGLNVGFYTNGSFAARYNTASPVQVSLDNYFVVVGEYDSLDQAQAMQSRVIALGLSADLYVQSRAGKSVYQVVNGYYETSSAVNAAYPKLKNLNSGSTIKGYFRLTTGKLSDRTQAEATAASLRSQSFDAYPLVRRDGSWEVWIGDAASSSELDTLQAALKAKTGTSYSNADYSGADYLLLKTSALQGASVPHAIICSDTEEAAFVPTGSPAVTRVYEHYNREYRGSILVQGNHSMPNVINSLPLDQYLYGVLPQEMSSGWPTEALKAQAVAARTYASRLLGSNKWSVADISDDVYDQAYRGYSRESDDTSAAVDATKGQVLMKNGALIDALYSSNNGGYTGAASEMWNSSADYLAAVDSPFDKVAADQEPLYYRVQLTSGRIGWIKANAVNVTGKNVAGFQTGTITIGGQPVRAVPEASATVLVSATSGDHVVILDQEKEYNSYNWQRGPYSPTDMMNMINTNQADSYPTVSAPVYDLHVSKTGQGGRVMEIVANGTSLSEPNPDYYRALFDDMSSTRMTIDAQGTYTVLGANGAKTEYPNAQQKGQTLHVITASGTVTTAVNGTNDQFVLLGAGGQSRVVAKTQTYVLHGNGWGHGLGMSQWGANGMAQSGYTYDQILTHYYKGVSMTSKQ